MKTEIIIKDAKENLNEDKLFYSRNFVTNLYEVYENSKPIWYIGMGRLVYQGDEYMLVDIGDHTTINTIRYLKDVFEDFSEERVIKYIIDTNEQYQLNTVYHFIFKFEINVDTKLEKRLRFKISPLLYTSDIHLRYLKLYRMLRIKMMNEIAFHPRNVTFGLDEIR